MKILISLLMTVLGASSAFAGACADAYNKAIGSAEAFNFDGKGRIQILKADRIIVNEKTTGLHRLVLKNREEYKIQFKEGRISEIKVGDSKLVKFNGECQREENFEKFQDENAGTKIDAVESYNQGLSEQ